MVDVNRIHACGISDLAEGEVRRITPTGYPAIALYRVDGHFYATDDTCTHGDASLSDGVIEEGEIVCPFHLGRFCIRTGEAVAAPCITALAIYAVSVEGDTIFIDLPEVVTSPTERRG